MRTTLTLDPDVARLLKEESHRRHQPFKQVVNDAIRRGLSAPSARRRQKYIAPSFDGGLAPGIDPAGLNKLVDELEVEAFLSKHAR